MKEFIENLISRLEEQQAEAENEMHRLRSGDYVLPCSYDITDIKEIASESFKESIEIVNELAEEFATDINVVSNNGWIFCKERLPSKEQYQKSNGQFIVSDGNRTYTTYFDIYDTLKFGVPTIDHFRVDKCVIAWMPLPAPYKENENG